MGLQLAAKTGSQLAASPAVAEDLDTRRCWQQALTPGHELSPINSEDFDRLWEGFEQQEVKDIFTASEAEPCAARSSSAAPKQDEVQPKQGEARPTTDEKVGKGSRRANPKPRNKTRGKKSAEPAPPAGPQRPEDQPAQPAEAPHESRSESSTSSSRTREKMRKSRSPYGTPDCSEPCARSMEFLSTWKTATGPIGALWRTWQCRPRASRTSTPARGLARAIRPWWSCSATSPKER